LAFYIICFSFSSLFHVLNLTLLLSTFAKENDINIYTYISLFCCPDL
jgi:hypothetical protein